MATTPLCHFFDIGFLIIICTNVILTSGQCESGIKQLRVGPPGEIITLTSPNYPSNYPSFADCKWVLTAPPGDYLIELRIQSLEIERTMSCIYDSLVINDGSRSSSPLLEKLCGVKYPDVIQSSGSSIYIHFYSDSSTEKSGFEIDYTSIKKNSTEPVIVYTEQNADTGVTPPETANDSTTPGLVDDTETTGSKIVKYITEEGLIIAIVVAIIMALKYCNNTFCVELKSMMAECLGLAVRMVAYVLTCCEGPGCDVDDFQEVVTACNCCRLVEACKRCTHRTASLPDNNDNTSQNETHESLQLTITDEGEDSDEQEDVDNDENLVLSQERHMNEPGYMLRPTAPPDPEAPPPSYDELESGQRHSSGGAQTQTDVPYFPPPSYEAVVETRSTEV